MATKKQAGANKAIKKANEAALKKFPKTVLRRAFETMADAGAMTDAASDAKAAAALDVVNAAHTFRDANPDATLETVVTGWRDHVKVIAMELAIAGNRFAELTPASDDKAATAKLTGYGANVVSIAKGAIEYDLNGDSYRDVRKAVEAARAEAKRQSDPDAAALADAKSSAIESWDDLRKAVFDTGDAGLVNGLQGLLQDALAEFELSLEAQAEVEDQAEAA